MNYAACGMECKQNRPISPCHSQIKCEAKAEMCRKNVDDLTEVVTATGAVTGERAERAAAGVETGTLMGRRASGAATGNRAGAMAACTRKINFDMSNDPSCKPDVKVDGAWVRPVCMHRNTAFEKLHVTSRLCSQHMICLTWRSNRGNRSSSHWRWGGCRRQHDGHKLCQHSGCGGVGGHARQLQQQ